jgi:hypothetical protein
MSSETKSRAGRRPKVRVHPQVKAWRKWVDSEEGISCMAEGARGQYLENRLLRAFQAGWNQGIEAKS